MLDERVLVDALDVERLPALEFAVQEHLKISERGVGVSARATTTRPGWGERDVVLRTWAHAFPGASITSNTVTCSLSYSVASRAKMGCFFLFPLST